MLPEQDWLPQAKRLAVGMRMRVHHKNERRPNMTIGNERDRYWAYCQACKEGARLDKEHVLLAAHYTTEVKQLERPNDIHLAIGSEYEMIVARFLASKGMDFMYLPPVYVSPSTRRLIVQSPDGGWHGRDLTGVSNQKWLHYGAQFAGNAGPHTICTEDLFSMFKVQYALRDQPQWAVCSTLGSSCGPVSALALKDCKSIVWAYDADKAGDDGFKQASKRMRPFVPEQLRARPPEGLDPKDMSVAGIRNMIREVLNGIQR